MRKYFYILITLLAVLSIAFVGCKNKPTAVSDFVLDDLEEVAGSSISQPKGTIKGSGDSIENYAGNSFKSGKYKYGSSSKEVEFTLDIKTEGGSTVAIIEERRR
ncbi:hypothetical protein [Brachyspira aalborgi]|uniref:Lipoprotein n=1 Tax=Brachyspira aalborgi TaxID=29522 RepID=A0A5C8CI88_9SPIR|nr:hypothetical protein [Brachyspira aalborgi]TXJ12666.1 hypothetical protein EPJ80_03425 [Brachyspira aalborgi]